MRLSRVEFGKVVHQRKRGVLSPEYKALHKAAYYHKPELMQLVIAGITENKLFEIGEVVIFDDLRPVKILAGFSSRFLIGQFLDRIDTPIRHIDVKRLWTPKTYENSRIKNQREMSEVFAEFEKLEKENTNAIDDSWW